MQELDTSDSQLLQPRLMDLLHWVRTFKNDIHCKSVRSPSDLRNGLALTAIVVDIFTQKSKRPSSPQATSKQEEQDEKAVRAALNSSPATCRSNLTSMLSKLPKNFDLPSEFTGNSLYNDADLLEKFLRMLYQYQYQNQERTNNPQNNILTPNASKTMTLSSSSSKEFQKSSNSKRPPMPLRPKQSQESRQSKKQQQQQQHHQQKQQQSGKSSRDNMNSSNTMVDDDDSNEDSTELFYASDLNMLNQDEEDYPAGAASTDQNHSNLAYTQLNHSNSKSDNNNNIIDDSILNNNEKLPTTATKSILEASSYSIIRPNSPYQNAPNKPSQQQQKVSMQQQQNEAISRPRQNSFSSDISEIPFPKNAAQTQLTPAAQISWINDETPQKEVNQNNFINKSNNNNQNKSMMNSSFESSATGQQPSFLKVSSYLNSSTKFQPQQQQQQQLPSQSTTSVHENKRQFNSKESPVTPTATSKLGSSTSREIASANTTASLSHQPRQMKSQPPPNMSHKLSSKQIQQNSYKDMLQNNSMQDEDMSASFLSKHLYSESENNQNTNQQQQHHSKQSHRNANEASPTERHHHNQQQQQIQKPSQNYNYRPNSSKSTHINDNSPFSQSRERLKQDINALDAAISEESRAFTGANQISMKHSNSNRVKVIQAPVVIAAASTKSIGLQQQQSVSPSNPSNQLTTTSPLIVTPIKPETPARLLKWLIDIGLLRKDIPNLGTKLPTVCANGVIFFDIINRLQSRSDSTLLGCTRQPKTPQQLKGNYTKLFAHLRTIPRMNSRYLFHAENYLISGNSDVFWGLLDDLWHFFHRKNTITATPGTSSSTTPDRKQPRKNTLLDESHTIIDNKENSYEMFVSKLHRAKSTATNPTTIPVTARTTQTFNTQLTTSTNNNAISTTTPTKQQMKVRITPDPTSVFSPGKSVQLASSSRPNGQPAPATRTTMPSVTPQNNNNHSDSFSSKTNRTSTYCERSPSYKRLDSYTDITHHRKAVNIQLNGSPAAATQGSTGKGTRRRSLTPSQSSRRNISPYACSNQEGGVSFFSNSSFNYQHQGSSQSSSHLQLSHRKRSRGSNDNSFTRNSPRCLTGSSPQSSHQGYSKPTKFAALTPLTLETEMQTREFLSRLNFTKYLVKKDKPLFEDPLRNGTLFALLIHSLNQSCFAPPAFPRPANVNECHENVAVVFAQLSATAHAIPRCLLVSVDSILKGDHDAIWGLLYYIMKNEKVIKSVNPILSTESRENKFEISIGNTEEDHSNAIVYLPYSAAELSRIESMLLNWVNQTLFQKETISDRSFPPSHTNPLTEAHRIANIRKALTILRKIPSFTSKTLWMEVEFANADHSTIILFLQDMRRYVETEQVRSYSLATNESTTTKRVNEHSTYRTSNSLDMKKPRLKQQLNLQTIGVTQDAAIIAASSINSATTTTTTTTNILSARSLNRNQIAQPAHQFPPTKSAALTTITQSSSARNISEQQQTSTNTLLDQRQLQRVKIEQYPAASLKSNRSNQSISVHSTQSGREITPSRNPATTSSPSPFISHLCNWLNELNVADESHPITLEDLSKDRITLFQDGLLLCRITEKLIGKQIPGVIASPNSQTSCTSNLKKALFALSQQSRIDANLLLDEKHFVTGKQNYILAFLSSLKQAFKTQLIQIKTE